MWYKHFMHGGSINVRDRAICSSPLSHIKLSSSRSESKNIFDVDLGKINSASIA